MSEIPRSEIRSLVRGIYQVQALRIATGLKIVANFKTHIGQAPSTPEKELDAKGQRILSDLRNEYNRLTDGVVNLPSKNKIEKEGELISNYAMFTLVHQYEAILTSETQQFKMLGTTLKDIPIYSEFISKVKGIGPAIAGVIVSELDIHKATYVSCIWKYLGLDVAPDGRGRGRYKDHLVDKEFANSDGGITRTKGLSYNPWAKTKILYVGGGCLLKSRDYYYDVYIGYKHRLVNRADIKKDRLQEKTQYPDARIHAMANRYMVKIFLSDLYEAWRSLEGLEVHDPYHEAKLNMAPHKKAAA